MWKKVASITPTWTRATKTHRATVHRWGNAVVWEVRTRADTPWVNEGSAKTVADAKRAADNALGTKGG